MRIVGIMALSAAVALSSCGGTARKTAAENDISFIRTSETECLLLNLKKISAQGFMFGHHDDTVYGIGWENEEERSDVQSVCGDYPAVISFDLGELELGGDANLDKVSFDKIRKEVLNQYQRGGMISLSWHARNPKTGGDAWDVSDTTAVKSVLPGGTNHSKFAGWLSRVADFINSLRADDGTKIPVLFRPWHEHTGSWFWWGEKLCSQEDYKKLWRMTVDSLRAHGVDNALYAYSSGTEPRDTLHYLQRYPGDDLIDVIGFDAYQFDRSAFLTDMDKLLCVLDTVASTHGKVAAVSEVGYEGIPDAKWWTGTFLPALEKHSPAYALVWRNARERVTHFYAPYPGQTSAADFVDFYNNPKTLFAADVNLYK